MNPKILPSRATHRPGTGIPRIGRFHKGAPKPEGRPGKDLDYFRVTFEPQFEYLRPLFESIYGTEPREFRNAYISGSDPESMFRRNFEEYGNGLKIVCDGTNQTAWFDPAIGRMNQTPRPCQHPACQCKMVGHLKVMLGEFMRLTKVYGYFGLDLTSEIEINRIAASLYDLEDRLGGALPVCSFVVGRAMENSLIAKRDKNGKPTGERMNKKQSLIYVTLDGAATEKLANSLEQSPLALAAPEQPALPAVTEQRDSSDKGAEWRDTRSNDEIHIGAVTFREVTVIEVHDHKVVQTISDPVAYTYTREPFRVAGVKCDEWRVNAQIELPTLYTADCKKDSNGKLVIVSVYPVTDIPF